MPSTALVFPEFNLLLFRYLDTVSIEDLLHHVPAPRPGERPALSKVIQDTSAMTKCLISLKEFRSLASRMNSLFRPTKTPAIHAVLGPQDIGYGMGRMYQSIVTQEGIVRCPPFRELHGVMSYLSLPPEAEKALLDAGCGQPPNP